MSRADRFDFTLDKETEKRLYDLMTDIDTRNTNRFWITDKHGYHAEYVKVIRCKDCKYYLADPWGYGNCNQMTFNDRRVRDADYCSWSERREE